MLDLNFAKLENGLPAYLRTPVRLTEDMEIDGQTFRAGCYLSTNRPEVIAALGYKPVRHTIAPVEEGYTYSSSWTETETEIIQVWEAVPIPDDPYEIIDVLTGETNGDQNT